MPRWMYGTSSSGVPLGPTVPTVAPSATAAPFATASVPRCVSVTASASAVRIVTDLPLVGTEPANVTSPAAGATTAVPAGAPTSTPRCCPPAYGCAGSNENGASTGPSTGHVHAAATGAHNNARITTAIARTTTPFCCQDGKQEWRRLATASAVVNSAYSVPS